MYRHLQGARPPPAHRYICEADRARAVMPPMPENWALSISRSPAVSETVCKLRAHQGLSRANNRGNRCVGSRTGLSESPDDLIDGLDLSPLQEAIALFERSAGMVVAAATFFACFLRYSPKVPPCGVGLIVFFPQTHSHFPAQSHWHAIPLAYSTALRQRLTSPLTRARRFLVPWLSSRPRPIPRNRGMLREWRRRRLWHSGSVQTRRRQSLGDVFIDEAPPAESRPGTYRSDSEFFRVWSLRCQVQVLGSRVSGFGFRLSCAATDSRALPTDTQR